MCTSKYLHLSVLDISYDIYLRIKVYKNILCILYPVIILSIFVVYSDVRLIFPQNVFSCETINLAIKLLVLISLSYRYGDFAGVHLRIAHWGNLIRMRQRRWRSCKKCWDFRIHRRCFCNVMWDYVDLPAPRWVIRIAVLFKTITSFHENHLSASGFIRIK